MQDGTLAEEEKQKLREALEQQREFRRQAQSLRWRNPIQDKSAEDLRGDSKEYGTEKTGSCRYGEACSKFHPYPASSTTILIKNMYDGPGMTEVTDEDNDDDLEHSEDEIQDHFKSFWKDIVPEFKRFGEVQQLRVCRNHSFHLRGNVYVMYKTEEEAKRAFDAFNGRFYAGRKLILQYSPVVNWKSAVCGLFTKGQCERGKACNFLHVFRNPGGILEGREDRDRADRERGGDRDRERHDRDKPRRGPHPDPRDRHGARDRRDYPREERDRYRDEREHREHRDHRDEREYRDRRERDRHEERHRSNKDSYRPPERDAEERRGDRKRKSSPSPSDRREAKRTRTSHSKSGSPSTPS